MAPSADVSSLDPVELQLLREVSEGKWLDLAAGASIGEAEMPRWDAERTIHASLIRDILCGRLATDADPHGVRIRGARLVGRLDLASLSTKVNLELRECFLPEGLVARDAYLSVLRLEGCRVEHSSGAAVAADRLSASLMTLNGSTVVGHGLCGAVSLFGARITRVECDGADFCNDSGPALYAEAVQVEQDMFLRTGFKACGAGEAGAVCLLAARLSRLECDGATLRNESGPAIRADSAVVDQRLCLRNGFQALGAGELGAVRLNGAQIGLLLCDGARFVNNSGPAFFALALHVERGIFLRDGFQAIGVGPVGAMRLPGARMTRLESKGAKLSNCSGPALFAEAMQVEQDVLLGDGFEAERAHIVGHDWGAALAWVVASLVPDRVDHLAVLSVGHPSTFRRTLAQREKSWYMLLFQFVGVAEQWLSDNNWANFRSWARHPDSQAVIAELEATKSLTPALNWYRANVPPESWVAPPPALPAVQAPTMGIWSSGDMALTETQMTDSAENVAGPWRYERIDGPGHWMQLEAPDTINQLLLDFLPG